MIFALDTYFNNIHSCHDTVGNPGDWIAVGCSHTAGYGVTTAEIYINLLTQPVRNLALGMGNAGICRRNAQVWMEQSGQPGLVIAQWPNAMRRTTWHDNLGSLVSVQHNDSILNTMVKAGDNNLWAEWLDHVISLNQFCRACNTPIINILLETLAPEYSAILNQHSITVHDDKKLPGQSWMFDCAGTDGQHHSAQCHQLWAERLQGIVNEVTAP